MDFLKSCARALDSGEPADAVLARMRRRYTTARSLNVHTCKVRQLCAPTAAYVAARDALLRDAPDDDARARLVASIEHNDPEVRALLPHRLPENVYSLRVTRDELRECKRLQSKGALRKNYTRRSVDGKCLLLDARAVLQSPEAHHPLDVTLSLLLLTGRRTCEITNGRSTLAEEDDHAASFQGQAKKRGAEVVAYTIPLLAPYDHVSKSLAELRRHQRGARRSNQAASRCYQSALSQRLKARGGPWAAVGCVHDLRGLYACMSLRLFQWPPEFSDAFLAMSFLGHSGIEESLVYTPFHLGDCFAHVPSLGQGRFTPAAKVGGD